MTAIIHTWSCILLYVLIGWKLAELGKLTEFCFKEMDGLDLLPNSAVALVLSVMYIIWIVLWPILIGYALMETIIKRCKRRRTR